MIGSESTPSRATLLLREQLGDSLHAVVLCGSAASGRMVPGWSDLDLLIVLAQRNLSMTLRHQGPCN